MGIRDAYALNDADLVVRLRADKTANAAEFAARVRRDADLAQRTPEAFRAAIEQLRGLT